MKSDVKVPILLMAFIRPDLLKKCLHHLEKFRPPVIYVMGDGPRNEKEAELCQESRSIALNPGWDCDIIPIFNDENEGIVKSFIKGMRECFQSTNTESILKMISCYHPVFTDSQRNY